VTEQRERGNAAAAPRRGRPRSESAHRAILAAAAELLLEQGLGAASMDAVAARAGVSKATIYRWWPSKERLALDALYADWAHIDVAEPDTGTVRGDLLALVGPWVRELSRRPYGRLVAEFVVAAHTDLEFARDYRVRFVEPRRERMRAVFTRAIERDEIAQGTDVEIAVDLIYGALYHRLLHRHAPLTAGAAESVVDTALRGIAPATVRGRT
jgi:AcrR family transcriptional regulator